jgi:hypothetical protein
MNSTDQVKFEPMTAESPDGNKLIIFTPGKGIEARDECDVIVNDFGAYGLGNVDCPYKGWTGISISVTQGTDEALVFTTYIQDSFADLFDSHLGRTFSHFALSFKDGAVRIAAGKLREVGWWYLNRERETDTS